MNKDCEIIRDKRKILAIIIRKKIKTQDVSFFSPKNFPLQIGFHNRPKNTFIKPHFHPPHNFFIKSNQEVLFVLSGKIKISLYNKQKKLIAQKILFSGDSILLANGGHAVKFLANSKIFEVKQGPYPGEKKAKIFF